MKKAVWLVVALVLVICCSVATADSTRKSGLYTYEFKGNGTLRITDFDWNSNQSDIYIPSILDGYEVAIIGEGAFRLSEGESSGDVIITLPNTITSIEDFAFENAPVTTINIPVNTQSIGTGAFLVQPSTGYVNFNVASGHTTFATIGGVLFKKTERSLVCFPWRSGQVESYEIPNGIQKISPYAFFSRSDKPLFINDLKLPETLSSIGAYAFTNTAIYLDNMPDSITEIGEFAFNNCEALQGEHSNLLSLSNSLTRVPKSAYENNHAISGCAVTIPDSVSAIDECAFKDTEISSVVINGNTKTIGNEAFANTSQCKQVTVSAGVESIGDQAFSHSGVTTLTLEPGLKTIGMSCFAGCNGLTTIVIPEGTTSIGSKAFSECSYLTFVSVPASVKSIGEGVFERNLVTMSVEEGSYAESYAIENGIRYQYQNTGDDTSWLTDDPNAGTSTEDTSWLDGE